jgi:hypothetical protein
MRLKTDLAGKGLPGKIPGRGLTAARKVSSKFRLFAFPACFSTWLEHRADGMAELRKNIVPLPGAKTQAKVLARFLLLSLQFSFFPPETDFPAKPAGKPFAF